MRPSLLSNVFLTVVLWSGRLYANECYSSIIIFGDSLSDNGNIKYLASIYDDLTFKCVPPYGQNFLGATGRCSNGRLIIDFIAEGLGLPLIQPYFNKHISDMAAWGKQGVNYAVSGATAMDSTYIESIWSGPSVIKTSLRVQLSWFKESLSSICGNISDCRHFLERSLIIMGEIGWNDYNNPLSIGIPIDEIKPYVPLVVDNITSAINELIAMGAQNIIVPGVFPSGCFPVAFVIFGSYSNEYDPETGCLTKVNELVIYHNDMLQTKLNLLRELNPNAVIIYGDSYNALMQIFKNPKKYGFTIEGISKACCGCGGRYNFNTLGLCGAEGTILCDDPDTYVSWDGVHLTEAANKEVFKSLFQGPYTTPKFNSMCLRTTLQAEV